MRSLLSWPSRVQIRFTTSSRSFTAIAPGVGLEVAFDRSQRCTGLSCGLTTCVSAAGDSSAARTIKLLPYL
jgi:hypothetical protein